MKISAPVHSLSALVRQDVNVCGTGDAVVVLGPGYGCSQQVWDRVAPALEARARVVRFDYVGMGGSDLSAYDPQRYGDLRAHADDLLEVLDALDAPPVVFVGHSVGATIGLLAAARRPQRFASLVLLGPSPCYIDDPASGYVGGFSARDIDDLLATMESNFLGWSRAVAPMIVGRADRRDLADELGSSFCRNDPDIAQQFARVTFLSDHRAVLAAVRVPTLVLQCRDDAIAPDAVGRYVHEHIPGSILVLMDACGHCPHMSAPDEVIELLQWHLDALASGHAQAAVQVHGGEAR